METNDERRRRKLTDLVNEHGIEKVAEAAGLSAQYLDQIIKRRLLPPKRGDGSRSERTLGDSAARAIEGALLLERGWFDNEGESVDMTAKEMQLLGYFRELDPSMQTILLETVREAANQQAKLREQFSRAIPPVASRQGKAQT